MDLVPYMYYERQEAGSQLCAQHCLNNLLQQHTYTEFDLADLAQKLDQAENATLSAGNQNKKSYNYDDTGFFSIAVLERALEVWDLSLVRWRGEAMKQYQEHPEEQAAFILNLSQHWLPLRRFSPAADATGSASTKRWYNLNSFLPNGPEWISPTYLRMVLTQAEQEGYSVFVVRKANPTGAEGTAGWTDGGVAVLPECTADRMAVTLGEPSGRGGLPAPASHHNGVGSSSGAALGNPDLPSVDTSSLPIGIGGPSSPPDRRRRRQGDLALQESSPSRIAPPPRHPRRRYRSSSELDLDVTAEQEDELDMDMDPSGFPVGRPEEEEVAYHDDNDEVIDDSAAFGYSGPTDFAFQSRSYDDEDTALQAALKASMADLPEGWVAPEDFKSKEQPIKREAQRAEAREREQDEAARRAEEEAQKQAQAQAGAAAPASQEDEADEPSEVLSPDEIRRRRLARFG